MRLRPTPNMLAAGPLMGRERQARVPTGLVDLGPAAFVNDSASDTARSVASDPAGQVGHVLDSARWPVGLPHAAVSYRPPESVCTTAALAILLLHLDTEYA